MNKTLSWTSPAVRRFGTFAELTQEKVFDGSDVGCQSPTQAQSPDRTCVPGGGVS